MNILEFLQAANWDVHDFSRDAHIIFKYIGLLLLFMKNILNILTGKNLVSILKTILVGGSVCHVLIRALKRFNIENKIVDTTNFKGTKLLRNS